MALTNIRLGDYIERSTANNSDLTYGNEYIVGVSSQGVFTEPKGNTDGVDLQPYKIVNNGAFVYTPTRINLGSIAYRTQGLCLVSHLYIVFYLSDEGKKLINPTWLYMYLRRKEFGREIDFRLFGSARPEFSFSDICETIIPLPDIETQNKYVTIYNAMLSNQQSYEFGLEELKLICDGYIEDLRRKTPSKPIGEYLELVDSTNSDLRYSLDAVRGISIEKKFIETKANMEGVNLTPYLVIQPGEFGYAPVTSRNGGKISIALNDSDDTYICSSSYVVFKSKNAEDLWPHYLMLFFSRTEFDRYARFNSWGSARETFDWDEMCNVRIPIPEIGVQKAIAEMFTVFNMRKQISEQLKAQIKDICPILIKGSIKEGELV